jgi:hypothetical protein
MDTKPSDKMTWIGLAVTPSISIPGLEALAFMEGRTITLLGIASAILIAVAAMVLAIVVGAKRERKRREDFRALANRLGCIYLRNDDGSVESQLDRFQLASVGQRGVLNPPHMADVLRGEYGKYAITYFEYGYVVRIGGRPLPFTQTVLLISSADLSLPQFVLKPRKLAEKIGELVGMQQPVVLGNETFNKTFVLQGSDDSRIRETFSSDVIDALLPSEDCYLEGTDDTLLFSYKHRMLFSKKRLEVHEVEPFIEQGCALAKLLATS